MVVALKDILKFLDKEAVEYQFEGDMDLIVNGFSSLSHYNQGNITWIKTAENLVAAEVNKTIALAVIQEGIKVEDVANKIVTEESKRVFFSILDEFFSGNKSIAPVGHGTYIAPEVKLGKNVIIGHNCTLDGNIIIGDNTRIYNNVNIINNVEIGDNCEIQSSVNIGHDGFAFTENENHEKKMVKHYGGVKIGNNVYIGGNSYIERGTIDNTVIGDGTKIDGACVIGHNSIINKNVAMVGGTTIFGSVTIGDNAYIASGLIKNKINIGSDSLIGMGAVVTKDVENNTTVAGVPAKKFDK